MSDEEDKSVGDFFAKKDKGKKPKKKKKTKSTDTTDTLSENPSKKIQVSFINYICICFFYFYI